MSGEMEFVNGTEAITPEICRLHRELINEKIASCDARVDGIYEELRAVRDLQVSIRNTMIVIAAGVILTLLGVLLGRGVDFGWIIGV